MKTLFEQADQLRLLHKLPPGEPPGATIARALAGADDVPLINAELLRLGNAAHLAAVRTLFGAAAAATTLAGYGITDAQPLDAKLTTITTLKRYVALITQNGTSAPTATVLENTLGGTVVWTRLGAGDYVGTLSGAFPAGKVDCFFQGLASSILYYSGRSGNNTIALGATDLTGSHGDDLLALASLRVTVYP